MEQLINERTEVVSFFGVTGRTVEFNHRKNVFSSLHDKKRENTLSPL